MVIWWLGVIHEVALPATMSIRSSLVEPKSFQKWAKAVIKSELGVSSQDISSINTTFLSSLPPFVMSLSNSLKASRQDKRGTGIS